MYYARTCVIYNLHICISIHIHIYIYYIYIPQVLIVYFFAWRLRGKFDRTRPRFTASNTVEKKRSGTAGFRWFSHVFSRGKWS